MKNAAQVRWHLTNGVKGVILSVERVLPVDGQPSDALQEVTALFGRRGGYFLLLAAKNRLIMPTIKMPI